MPSTLIPQPISMYFSSQGLKQERVSFLLSLHSYKNPLSPFWIPSASCHYIFNCRFTSSIPSAKSVLSICSMPGSHSSELWRMYQWLQAKKLLSCSLFSWGNDQQTSISPTINSPRGKCQMATIPGQSSTLNRAQWCKAIPHAAVMEGCPEEVTTMLGAGGRK